MAMTLAISLLTMQATAANAQPALITAAKTGNIVAMRSLLAHGANPNTTDSGGISALEWAAAKGHLDEVLALLKAHAAVDGAYNPGKYTPLMRAANFGFPRVVAALIAHGANVNAFDSIGQDALDYARIEHHKDVVALLVRHGATSQGARSPQGFCHAGAAEDFSVLTPWVSVPKNPRAFYCQSGKHDFGTGAGDVIMYTFEVDGSRTIARSVYIRTDIFMDVLPTALVTTTLKPLLEQIYAYGHKGPIPVPLLTTLLSLASVQQDTPFGNVIAVYKNGDKPQYPIIGASYIIRIQIH